MPTPISLDIGSTKIKADALASLAATSASPISCGPMLEKHRITLSTANFDSIQFLDVQTLHNNMY